MYKNYIYEKNIIIIIKDVIIKLIRININVIRYVAKNRIISIRISININVKKKLIKYRVK